MRNTMILVGVFGAMFAACGNNPSRVAVDARIDGAILPDAMLVDSGLRDTSVDTRSDAQPNVDATQSDARDDANTRDAQTVSGMIDFGSYDLGGNFTQWQDGHPILLRSPILLPAPQNSAPWIPLGLRLPRTPATASAQTYRASFTVTPVRPPNAYDPNDLFTTHPVADARVNNVVSNLAPGGEYLNVANEHTINVGTFTPTSQSGFEAWIGVRVEIRGASATDILEIREARILLQLRAPYAPEDRPFEVGDARNNLFFAWTEDASLNAEVTAVPGEREIVADFRIVATDVLRPVTIQYSFAPVDNGIAVQNEVTATFVRAGAGSLAENVRLVAPSNGRYRLNATATWFETGNIGFTANFESGILTITD